MKELKRMHEVIRLVPPMSSSIEDATKYCFELQEKVEKTGRFKKVLISVHESSFYKDFFILNNSEYEIESGEKEIDSIFDLI